MAYDYNNMVKSASSMITEFGQVIEVIDKSQNVIWTGKSVRATVTTDNVPNTLIKNTDTIYYLPADAEVNTTHYIRSNNTLKKIIGVDYESPGDTLILYKVYASG